MLLEIRVRNFAVIDAVTTTFGPGLNVLTGETGAGKSMLLDAILLIRGARAQTDVIRTDTETATVEAVFDVALRGPAAAGLEDAGLGLDQGQLVVRRELSRSGRHRAFVNDSPVTVGLLERLGDHLVEIHGQHEHQRLLEPSRQLDLLDRFADAEELRDRVGDLFAKHRAVKAELERARAAERDRAQREDLLHLQVSELDTARLRVGEEEELRVERRRLQHAERLSAGLAEAAGHLNDDDGSAMSRLHRTARLLRDLARVDPAFAAPADSVDGAGALVEDALAAIRSLREGAMMAPGRLEAVDERLDALTRLKRKYGDTESAMLAFRDEAATELERLGRHEAILAEQERALGELDAELSAAGHELAKRRHDAAERLAGVTARELRQLGMERARFEIAISRAPFEEIGPRGLDRVEFRLSTNPGEDMRPLARIASGGELSRTVLALKAILARADRVPTMIFDEVDSGIGGRVAAVVAQKLATAAEGRQVLCVTHLAPIAARAAHHVRVSKSVRAGRTRVGAERRTVEMRHFDVQLIGGMVLHAGTIAEMATGEGKTLVATLPAYLNALTGRGVHIVTVNDYLAKRDAQWMGPIYEALGLSVGVIQHEASFLYDPAYVTSDIRLTSLRPCTRQEAYRADVTYGTNNEFGFDYLRDNMRFTLEELVQRELHYAIVDEVDSILIDEARTPLIISGPADESTDLYFKLDRIIPKLRRAATIVEGKLSEIEAEMKGDFIVDEKARAVALTEEGIASCERLLNVDNLYDPRHMTALHHIQQGLRAHALFRRDVDYIIKDGQVVIIDEFTGRQMPGRRWSDGLHQAVEDKEGVRIERENQTLAKITFQNYFRMYEKLAGMTGTAETEAEEFAKIYKLGVTVIPTNRTLIRVNNPDVVYKTEREKFNAVVEDIIERNKTGQPVLVGTVSIEKSETLSSLLKKRGIRHEVLNAKYHEREAEIVAQAGRESAVTIATNMAGRGTDILLGGNPDFLSKEILRKRGLDPVTAAAPDRESALVEARRITEPEHQRVVERGGLHIVGTERHEARRVDNQLRGRSGRQGDPGSSHFYLPLEDDLP